MGHTSGALAPRNSVGCVRRRQDAIFLFTFDWRGSDPTPVGCVYPYTVRHRTTLLRCERITGTGTNRYSRLRTQTLIEIQARVLESPIASTVYSRREKTRVSCV